MQIIHRVSFHSSPALRKELAAMGRIVSAAGFVMFEIDEGDSSWPAIQAWIAKRDAFDYVNTKFSQREIDDARWLKLIPDWHQGYPAAKARYLWLS
jgi:hypothetical protein